jgi:transposase
MKKNAAAQAQFQETLADQIQACIPPDNERPVEVVYHDESRWGLRTIRRRRITARGVKPVGTIQHRYANFWCYTAALPASGNAFSLILPRLDVQHMQIFLDALAAAYPDSFLVLVLDRSGAHTSPRLRCPANIALLFLPPYSPELNPIERVWRQLRDRLAWQRYATLDDLEQALCAELDRLTPAVVLTLIGYQPILRAITTVYEREYRLTSF